MCQRGIICLIFRAVTIKKPVPVNPVAVQDKQKNICAWQIQWQCKTNKRISVPGKSSGNARQTKETSVPGKSSGSARQTKETSVPGKPSGSARQTRVTGIPETSQLQWVLALRQAQQLSC
eukprot:1159904-Pelagomonas_calceolata.AAC.4